MNLPGRVVVAGTTLEELARLLPFALVIAESRGQPLMMLALVLVPETESLSSGARAAMELRRQIKPLFEKGASRIVVRVTHNRWNETARTVRGESQDLIVVDWASAPPAEWMRTVPSDIVIVNGSVPRSLRQILLPIRGGPYAALALEVALAFAQANDAKIALLHAVPPEQLQTPAVRGFLRHLRSLPQITEWIHPSGDAAEAIIEQAQPKHAQMLVVGSVARPMPGASPIGPTATRVVSEISIPALIVKTKGEQPPAHPDDPNTTPVDYTISVVVDKWFAENTFHAHEFADIKQLVALKKRQGLTISLGLPTLNEQTTIGKVVRTVRKLFVERYPLLDEVVVIDSNSTDRTVEIAESLGVRVVKHPDVLTRYGTVRGKGEALWNSLYVLRGDLIAWIDTDIVNIHPRFVYGILGPLIREPRLMFVKGFYQRPLRTGENLHARGGGRVTELVARPLLNLFYPELSGFVQPLAGEYAGRRKALEAVPFVTGYGVEIAMLIDILTKFGLQSMGQVDLEERVHRNQSLLSLSKMSFEIIQVVLHRVGHARGVDLLNELNSSLKLIQYEEDVFQLDVTDIRVRERPPMITIPEYRRARQAASAPKTKRKR